VTYQLLLTLFSGLSYACQRTKADNNLTLKRFREGSRKIFLYFNSDQPKKGPIVTVVCSDVVFFVNFFGCLILPRRYICSLGETESISLVPTMRCNGCFFSFSMQCPFHWYEDEKAAAASQDKTKYSRWKVSHHVSMIFLKVTVVIREGRKVFCNSILVLFFW